MNQPWVNSVLRHLIIVLVGTGIGGLYGQPGLGLIVALVLLLAWHLYNLWLLERWLLTGDVADMPAGNGIWARVFARVDFFLSKIDSNKQKFRSLVKELRAATKAFPDGGVILNLRNEIIACNKPASALLGIKRKRDRGQKIDNFIRNPRFVEFLEQARQSKRAGQIELPAPVGDKWLSCRLMPYGLEQRLLLVSDITHAKRLETTRSDFVANASHELRSPLTVIGGYLDAMSEDEEIPVAWQQPVRDMREQSMRMSQLVTDLLQLSRLESSALSSKDRQVDVPLLLSTAKKEALACEHHPESIEIDIQTDANLLGEESELQSIISNLVSNAVRYTPDDGQIVISWSCDDSGGHLSVADTGIGIAAEDIPRLTERFFRADSGRARQKGGTGLGLAIVKYALKRHDAKLEIHSEPGQGSRFTCHFAPERISQAGLPNQS